MTAPTFWSWIGAFALAALLLWLSLRQWRLEQARVEMEKATREVA